MLGSAYNTLRCGFLDALLLFHVHTITKLWFHSVCSACDVQVHNLLALLQFHVRSVVMSKP